MGGSTTTRILSVRAVRVGGVLRGALRWVDAAFRTSAGLVVLRALASHGRSPGTLSRRTLASRVLSPRVLSPGTIRPPDVGFSPGRHIPARPLPKVAVSRGQ